MLLLVVAPGAVARTIATRAVRFHGYTLRVPATWPVFNLAHSPLTCVRFNRHAVYLGTPSADQRCPAHAVGRTEAVLIRPLAAGAAAGAPGELLAAGGAQDSFTVPGADVAVTATWGRARVALSRLLGRRLQAGPGLALRHDAVAHPTRSATVTHANAHAVTYAGLGFDACSTPSTAAMSDWSSSPYRALGVYIGGVNEGCSQPNLSSTWITTEAAAGWRYILTYVGLQGAGSCGGSCALISSSRAHSQGVAAANDAVTHAHALGIPAGNPIYDDMEQYNRSSSNSATVLAFLSGWTSQLHADGYLSGVYSSGSSGITDLAGQWGTGYAEPDDLWIADWNGRKTTADPYVPAADWPGASRLHQYDGAHNESYGGATINIDGDYLDGATAAPGNIAPYPDGTFVQDSGDPNIYRVAGGSLMYTSSWTGFGGAQPVTQITPQQFSEFAPYPVNGTFLTTTTGLNYRVAGGTAFPIASWTTYGAQQPSVMVDVFDLQNVGNPLVHLSATPLNGTTVEGLPSATYWTFTGGSRAQVSAVPGAVSVPDAALAAFPVAPDTGGVGTRKLPPSCVAPRLAHLDLKRTRAVLKNEHCGLGKVARPRHWSRHHLLRVVTQSVKPRSKHKNGFKISIRMV